MDIIEIQPLEPTWLQWKSVYKCTANNKNISYDCGRGDHFDPFSRKGLRRNG